MNKCKVIFKVTAFILAVMVTSCIKDTIDLDNVSHHIYWNPKLGTPVAYGNLSIEDLIESIDSEQVFREDPSHFLSLIYSNTILSGKAESLLKIGNQHYNEVLLESDYNLPSLPVEDTIVLNRTSNYTFSFPHSEVIDSVKLKAGTMVFNVRSSYKFKGKLKITVPKLTKNNKPLEILVDINKSDGTFTTSQNYDLAGYKLQLDHPHTNDNLLAYNYTAKLVNSGGTVSVGDNITIDTDFTNIMFSSMFGYIGNIQLLNTLSEFSIPLFQSVSHPNLMFANPSMKIRTSSSLGLPASVELYNIEAVSENDNVTVPVTFSSGTNPFNISYPKTIGGISHDTVIFNSQTTNLNEALAIGPSKINYGIRSFSNPAGKVYNYVTDSSKISIDLDVELPLDLKTSLIEFRDTMDLDLSDIVNNSKNIKSLLLHSAFENGMPFDLNLQVYLVDENYVRVDSLFSNKDQPVITSGTLDQQGKINGTTKKEIDVTFDDTEIEPLENVKYAIVKAGIITANRGTSFVKFYSNYILNVHFGVQTELEIKED